MQEAIDRILNGKFNNETRSLDFSSPVIEMNVNEGETAGGSFVIKGPRNVPVEGYVSSSRIRMKCLVSRFAGAEDEVFYEFDASGLSEGETLTGFFRIISNQGEYAIPYTVHVVAQDLDSSLGNIRNVFHFANLARTSWDEAVRLFSTDKIENLLQGVDKQYAGIYRGFRCAPNILDQYLEEFLIALRKKKKTEFLLEEKEIQIENLISDTEVFVVINRNGWGYSELTIEAQGHFLEVQKDKIRDDDFLGNCARLPVYLHADALHGGKNMGCVRLHNAYFDETVTVIAEPGTKNMRRAEQLRREKTFLYELMVLYGDFRSKKMNSGTWLKETETRLQGLIECDEHNIAYKCMQVQLLITQERYNEARWLMDQLEDSIQEEYSPDLYCYFLYLTTLFQREDAYIDEVAERVERILTQYPNHWRIAWLLIYLSEEYEKSPSKKWMILEDQFKSGAKSPVLYIEAYHLIAENPTLLMNLNSFEIQVLKDAARREILTANVIEQIVYLATKTKTPPKGLFPILTAAYKMFPSDGVLQGICTILINQGRTDEQAHEWYRKGIDKELRITRLYEHYMMSVSMDEEEEIPRMVLMYFAFESNLDSYHNAYLYAYISKRKSQFQELYETYKEQMINFMLDQLSKGRNNTYLAILYRNELTDSMIRPEIAGGLATALFTYEVKVNRDNICKAILVYDKIKGEIEIPVTGKKFYIPLYGSDFGLLLEDREGHRFCAESEYELTRLMIPDKLAAQIGPLVSNRILFDLWYCQRGRDMARITEDNADHMKRIMNSPDVIESVRRDIWMKLLHFYYEKDRIAELDQSLLTLDIQEVKSADLTQMIQFMVLRGMYEKAYKWILVCGGEGIEGRMILSLCSRLILTNEYREEDKDAFTALCFRAFVQGKYDEPLLRYLVENFQGSIREMRDVWREAVSNHIDVQTLSQRILIQILYTGAFMGDMDKIFQSYVSGGGDQRLILAYAAQQSHDYFVNDKLIHMSILNEIQRDIDNGEELPYICKLSYTKYYAENKKEANEHSMKTVMRFLREFLADGVYFEFFREYSENVAFMHRFLDKTIVEYHTKPGNTAVIHYLIEREEDSEGEYISAQMKEMYSGVFAKQFVLFFGERLQYYIVETEGDKEMLTESSSYSHSDMDISTGNSRYNLINDIATAKTLGEYGATETLLTEYYNKIYMFDEMFGMK